jgi:hypothetical protein
MTEQDLADEAYERGYVAGRLNRNIEVSDPSAFRVGWRDGHEDRKKTKESFAAKPMTDDEIDEKAIHLLRGHQ